MRIKWNEDYMKMTKLTWKYRMMVQTNPRTTAGFPSTMSDEFMFTNFICKFKLYHYVYVAKDTLLL